jgi:hypothetical protein
MAVSSCWPLSQCTQTVANLQPKMPGMWMDRLSVGPVDRPARTVTVRVSVPLLITTSLMFLWRRGWQWACQSCISALPPSINEPICRVKLMCKKTCDISYRMARYGVAACIQDLSLPSLSGELLTRFLEIASFVFLCFFFLDHWILTSN